MTTATLNFRRFKLKSLHLRSVGLVLLLLPVLCSARSLKLARDLDNLDPQSAVTVIVQYASPIGTEQVDKVAQRGGSLKKELGLIRGAVYSLPAGALESL